MSGGAFFRRGVAGGAAARLLRGSVERLRALPWGIGAAFHQGSGVPSVGEPGIFFACRTRGGERYWRFVQVDGTVIDAEFEMLRRINPGSAPERRSA